MKMLKDSKRRHGLNELFILRYRACREDKKFYSTKKSLKFGNCVQFYERGSTSTSQLLWYDELTSPFVNKDLR